MSSAARYDLALGLVRGHQRQAERVGRDQAGHLERGLDRDRVRRHREGLVERPQPGVDLAGAVEVAGLGRVPHLAHLRADQLRGDEDPPRPADFERLQERVVVAGEDREAVDQLQLVVVGLLQPDHVVDLGEPGEVLRGDVDDHPRGDVVGDQRQVGDRGGDRLEVGDDPGRVRLVVVGRDDQRRLGAGVGGGLGQLDRVAGVVGTGAADDRRPVADLVDDRSQQPDVLGVVERRRLSGRSGDDDPVRAVLDDLGREPARRRLVDRSSLLEGGGHRGEYAFQQSHHKKPDTPTTSSA